MQIMIAIDAIQRILNASFWGAKGFYIIKKGVGLTIAIGGEVKKKIRKKARKKALKKKRSKKNNRHNLKPQIYRKSSALNFNHLAKSMIILEKSVKQKN